MYKLLKNWKVVILSIGGATTFWFFNALNKDYTARINYPIEFLFERDSVVVMDPLPTTVTVDVASGGWNLLRKTFLFNIIPIQISLDNPTEISFYTRSSLFPIVSDQLSGLEVNYLVTDTIHINIEEKRSKLVRIKLDSTSIALDNNHRITSPIRLKPDTILLTGPKSFIDSLKNTYTFKLDSKKLDDEFSNEIEVGLPDRVLISSAPKAVKAAFKVERFDEVKISVPIEAVNFPADSSVRLSRTSVEVIFMAPKSSKNTYTAKDFAVTADLSMRNKKDTSVMAMLIFYPEEITDILLTPENIPLKYE